MRVTITIETRYELELEALTDDVREYITEHYEPALLPPEYQDDAEYDGDITYEIEEN